MELGLGDTILAPADRCFTIEAWLRVPAGDDSLRWAVGTTYQPFCSDKGAAPTIYDATAAPWRVSAHMARDGCGNDIGADAELTEFDRWYHLAMSYQVTGVSGSASLGTLVLCVDV